MVGGDAPIWILLISASITDLRFGKIFNYLTFPFFIAGLVFRVYWGGTTALGEGVLASVVAFFLFFPLWRLGVFAAGDVKLLMAVGAWTDANTIIQLGMFAILFGAVVGLYLLIRKNGFKGSVLHFGAVLKQRKQGFRIPFAPAFFCGFALLRIAEMKKWVF